jgi:hypothetical protein
VTITSKGYDGTVDEGFWSAMAGLVGVDGCVAAPADYLVTVGGTGTLPVTVAAGTIFGRGVMDINSAPLVMNATSLGSGTRWDTVVMDRNWSGAGGTSQLAIRAGGATPTVTLTNTTPGTHDDQPIALIKIVAGQAAVQQIIMLVGVAQKVVTVPLASQVPTIPVKVGGWIYAQDTDHTYHGELVGATPTWVDVDAPVWQNMSLAPGALVASGQAPQFCKIRGIVHLRGGIAPASGNFPAGNTTLPTLDAGFRPGAAMAFEVDHGRVLSTAVEVRISIQPTGAMSLSASGVTSACRLDGITFPAEN